MRTLEPLTPPALRGLNGNLKSTMAARRLEPIALRDIRSAEKIATMRARGAKPICTARRFRSSACADGVASNSSVQAVPHQTLLAQCPRERAVFTKKVRLEPADRHASVLRRPAECQSAGAETSLAPAMPPAQGRRLCHMKRYVRQPVIHEQVQFMSSSRVDDRRALTVQWSICRPDPGAGLLTN
jgi:hypothetical protein